MVYGRVPAFWLVSFFFVLAESCSDMFHNNNVFHRKLDLSIFRGNWMSICDPPVWLQGRGCKLSHFFFKSVFFKFV